jgi:hypothetical protein
MKYFRVVSLWVLFIWLNTLFGEYVVSREVNGFLQLLSFVGVVGILIYVINETIELFKNKKQND